MDLPPSGWYPDPYGTPALLRWWDGSGWTRHTHQDGAGAADVQATTVQPTAGALNRAEPPTGPPTSPQPALPVTTVQPAVRPTRVQATVRPTAFQPAAYQQPTAFQQTAYQQTAYQQPAAFQQTAYQPTMAQPGADGGGGGGGGGDGTQVMFFGNDAWQAPGTPGGPPRHGYGYRDARRRRMWLMGGLAAGTAAAVAVIAVIVAGLGSTPAATDADQTPTTPTAATTGAASATATPAPSATPSASTSAPAATLSDGQSGLSYTQLASPWQASCPSDLNNGAFSWTSGESAVAGQVNNGQNTWYGEACSGPLPAQYGYSGVAELENTATNLANTFEGAYYGALAHTAAEEVSQPVTISGHAGWEITFSLTYTNAQAQGATWSDEQAAVVVADTGTPNTPAVFFTSIPANLGESNVAKLVESLQLSVVPDTSGSPADDGSPNDNGSPAAGSNP
jgi:hypothetical protein